MELTPEEKELAARIGFDESVLQLIKLAVSEAVGRASEESSVQLTYYRSYETGRLTKPPWPPLEGVFLPLPQEITFPDASLRQELLGHGYLAFVFQQHDPILKCTEPGRVVLRTTDQFDILRAAYPEGNDDYVDNATILSQLQDWDRRYGVEIAGANGDRLEVCFKTMPGDWAKLGAEAIVLCPDLQTGYWELAEEQARKYYPFQDDEEGVANQMGYVVGRDIARDGRLFFWWD